MGIKSRTAPPVLIPSSADNVMVVSVKTSEASSIDFAAELSIVYVGKRAFCIESLLLQLRLVINKVINRNHCSNFIGMD